MPMPLVSCIMPTADRREFVPRAIECFLRQDYPEKELVILDDGGDGVADLIPADPRIRYFQETQRRSVGAKRNWLCGQARGEVIAHWDDDDWYAPNRLGYQLAWLLDSGKDLCGINRPLFYEPSTRRAWEYVYPEGGRFWLSGSTLCYWRRYWLAHPFRDVQVGEDNHFVWSGSAEQMLVLPDHRFHVAIIHDRNTSPKRVSDVWWKPFPLESIEQILAAGHLPAQPGTGAALVFPSPSQGEGLGERVFPAALALPTQPREEIPPMTVALASDLDLPEYRAFNQAGPALPRMRRWELPFVLFHARLDDTMAVLDCTINPVDFGHRLNLLYPHVLYRHWNPVQQGRFCLPFGFPEQSFDRVFCVNTLEHLLREQREALVAALSRLLKPGGWLLSASDYYFDSSWSNPAFLKMGVVRPDRAEVFNGWNPVRTGEWRELFQRHGLNPASAWEGDPQEGDGSLYLNDPPYAHATVGGVFHKGEGRAPADGRRVVLALLTWNTRDISLDSVRAYQQEALLLQRLGHTPVVCVCDNGSDDGTAQELGQAREASPVPMELILNDRNEGNSIARNQIIDFALESGADYLLFMDGDIEAVPFSSVAMLRYMESMGSRLGCIGADSAGQTPLREKAARCWFSVTGQRIDTTNLVAWTQYGMFRCEMFKAGVRFDASTPFDGPGWGFEDNDLAFQMDALGYVNQRFFGMTYLHRAMRSSIRVMRQRGIDAAALFARRKQYVVDKWAGQTHLEAGPLAYIRRVAMPAN
ncbi:GalNAc(5)-diNAcBac-PP-undecaprenol beta-1,3-glucosyltransferase [Anaerolineae bacterium]|nr:GalNAc(5)-diNAcBac-PP-undecaprenol beta-1,3-glucosyltransferase [Anaerolineae bacterium]